MTEDVEQQPVKQQRLQQRLEPEIKEFISQCKSLQLATNNQHGVAQVSYSPFAYTEQGYYILISDIAAHGKNIAEQTELSLMLLEDESVSKHIYARRRLSYIATIHPISLNSEEWRLGIHALQQRFGEIIDNLSQLSDFKLYRLRPQHGRYVKGFGQAFDITGGQQLSPVHLTQGHKKKA